MNNGVLVVKKEVKKVGKTKKIKKAKKLEKTIKKIKKQKKKEKKVKKKPIIAKKIVAKKKIEVIVKMKEEQKAREKARKIYLDHAATTPVRREVIDAMMPFFSEKFGNASSIYSLGVEASEALEKSRSSIASLLNCLPKEVIFTSGGTEADNLAIKGVALANKGRGNHIITTSIEHPAVLNTCKYLEENGFKVTYLPVDKDGFISLAELRSAITEKTILISIMHANNEIGTIQDIEGIGRIAEEKGIIFHTDAVQTFGKIQVDVKKMRTDLLSISSHKIYGPKGVGALYIKRGIPVDPLFNGGGHEFGKRSGTENIPGVVGFSTAATLACKEMSKESKRLIKLRDRMIWSILEQMKGVKLNGDYKSRLPNNVNFSFVGVEGESMVLRLNERGIFASTGSACSSKELNPSHVLLAIGLSPGQAHGSIRLTLGRDTTHADIDYTIESIVEVVTELREISKKLKSEI